MSEQKLSGVVLCDVDGVVADMLPAWLACYNAEYGDAVSVHDVTAWDVSHFVKPECGKRIFDYLHRADLYETVLPVAGALDGVEALRAGDNRVVFVTSCVGASMADAKIHWLFAHGFLTGPEHVGMRDLVIMQDKSMARGALMIDDYENNLRAFGGRGILFDYAYNRHCEDFPRAYGWADVVRFATAALRVAA